MWSCYHEPVYGAGSSWWRIRRNSWLRLGSINAFVMQFYIGLMRCGMLMHGNFARKGR